MKTYSLIFLLIIITSCDELLNPSSDYVIEKTVKVSSTEQVFQSGEDIKIIFPANSLKGDISLKVKKESSAPDYNLTNVIKGNKFYKIKFDGEFDFIKPINIIIDYNKGLITPGKSASDVVKAYIYSKGSWKPANFEIDEATGKIIITISSFNGRIKKDDPQLLDENEIIIGSGYTTTDTGQDDDFLAKMKKSKYISVSFSGYHNGLKNGEWSDIHFPVYFNMGSETFTDNLKWEGNQFSADLESGGKITGTLDSKGKKLSLQAENNLTKIWDDTTTIEAAIQLVDVPYDYDYMGYIYKFGLDGGGDKIKNMVKYVKYYKLYKNSSGVKEEEYKSTNYSENCWIEVEFIHQ